MAGLFRILRGKYILPVDTTTSFAGKTVLITGATTGLGLEAAKKVAALNPEKLVITARTKEKGQYAKEQIELHLRELTTDSGSRSVDIDIYLLDMSEFASVKAFAELINARIRKLDVVILNAGQHNKAWSKSVDGWEQDLQVNSLSTTLLALLLLPNLLAAADSDPKHPPHLNFISSGLARVVNPSLVHKYYDSPSALLAMSAEKAWPGGQPQYGLSKLLLEYSMRHIARLPAVSPPSGPVKVVVNSACPGMCKTDLGRAYTANSILFTFLVWLMSLLVLRSAEAGSRTYVSAVTRSDESQGKLWKDDRYFDGGEMIDSDDGKTFGEKMWREMVDVVAESSPNVKAFIAGS